MKSSALATSESEAVAPPVPVQDTPVIWVLCDDRAGNVSQCLGVAEKLGWPYEIKDIRYNAFAALPNHILGKSLRGLTGEARAAISPPWPDVVIAAGRRTVPVARYIKAESGGNTKLVQLMWPGVATEQFDLIATPRHDVIDAGANVISTACAAHRLTHTTLEAAIGEWPGHIEPMPRPWFALIVGGDTRNGEFTPIAARRLAQEASDFANGAGGSLLVTTSPRTRKESDQTLFQHLTAPAFVYEYGREENPYYAFLALADGIIVTGDSVSMASEATYTGKPVYIFERGSNISDKHRRFHELLYEEGMARPLEGAIFEPFTYTPVDVGTQIAEHIRAWFA